MADNGKIMLGIVAIVAAVYFLANYLNPPQDPGTNFEPSIVMPGAKDTDMMASMPSDDFKEGQKKSVSEGTFVVPGTTDRPQSDRKLNMYVYTGSDVNRLRADNHHSVSTESNLTMPREPISRY
tara:strand:+ start:6213 stop:6584 length:372 start_codon:yes stop_codon:yes gene_type:complete